jgi:hypothetical protein
LGNDSGTFPAENVVNESAYTYCSWTFREQPKFFDIVTYTGNDTNRTIAHNLGSVPGMIIVKRTSSPGAGGNWQVYHRSIGNDQYMVLNSASIATVDDTRWNNTTPTSSVFSLGTNTNVNADGATYVAYLFAHDAGGFGTSGTDNVISCGSYTGNGSTTGPVINLGYEPQWIMYKQTTDANNWFMVDNMRGLPVGGDDSYLIPNSTAAEASGLGNILDINATGFQLKTTAGSANGSGETYIYMAIRRPMKVPTTGTSVFSPVIWTGDGTSGRKVATGLSTPPDLFITQSRDGLLANFFYDRLRGISSTSSGSSKFLRSPYSNAEGSHSEIFTPDMVNLSFATPVYTSDFNGNTHKYVAWNFKRAPKFMDVVCYNETANPGTYNHNLGVVPELMIHKQREAAGDWRVYHKDCNTSWTYPFPILNSNLAGYYASTLFPSTPTSTTFTIDYQRGITTRTHVAYLFATLAGVSKVSSYTGNGSSQTINCGFTAGARFILIKRIDSNDTLTGDWYVWDTARGIVSGNDPHLSLNTTAAEVTTNDSVDPDNSGFIVNQLSATDINVSSATYIYLAIA